MYLIKNELKKSMFLPMMWIFLAICLLLNICIIAGYRYKIVDYSYFSYVGSTAAVTGTTIDPAFSEKLSFLSDSAQKKRLVSEIAKSEPIYADYDTSSLAETYIQLYGISGAWANLLKAKYEKLQYAVKRLEHAHAEFSLYSASTTAQMHHLLFGIVLHAILTEACILAALMMLHLFAYEYQNKTAMVIYSTRTGRKLFKYKLGAGLIAAAVCFAVLSAVTLFVYFTVFDYLQLWNSNVSSGFNYISERIGVKPFITWLPFTVGRYLVAMLLLGLSLTLVFAMIGAVIGLLINSSYAGALVFFLLALSMMTLPYACSEAGIWVGYFLTQFFPVPLWFSSSRWLTDMGSVSVIPLHELTGILINMLLWGLLVFVSYRYVKRKDMVSCC